MGRVIGLALLLVACPAAAQRADPAFGVRGLLRWRGGGGEHQVLGIALAPDGSIVAVGHMPFGGDHDVAVYRVTARGRLDRTFGSGGTARVGTMRGFGSAVALAPDGTIVVAG